MMDSTQELFAAIGNHESLEVIRGLIEAGADVHAKGNDGNTALSLALQRKSKNDEFAAILLDAGAVAPADL